jgi:Domain of unknown function (DUF4394)
VIDPDTALVTTDTPINPGTPRLAGAAYTNAFAGAVDTTLYGYAFASDRLVIQSPPNNGTVIDVGAAGGTLDVAWAVGFDIATIGTTNVGYGSGASGGFFTLFVVNLATGAMTPIGAIGDGQTPIVDIAVTRDPAPTTTTTTTIPPPVCPDSDTDRVPDGLDRCSGTPAGNAVDDAGCSQPQCCAGFNATTREGARRCRKADWQNDEPLLTARAADCAVQGRRAAAVCVEAPVR